MKKLILCLGLIGWFLGASAPEVFADNWQECRSNKNAAKQERACTQVINSGLNLRDAYFYRGTAFEKQAEFKQALSDYRQALKRGHPRAKAKILALSETVIPPSPPIKQLK